MYVANTRSSQYIHSISLDAAGNMVERRIFADLNQGTGAGHTRRLEGRQRRPGLLYRAGRIWVMAPMASASASSDGPSRRSILLSADRICGRWCCAHTSVYAQRVKVPGNPHPWYKLRGQSDPEDTWLGATRC
jgi:hypothetical protein